MSTQPRRKNLTRNQRAELFLEHGGICHLCGLRIHAERGESWEVEHVHAREMSGRDDWANLRPAHIACHKPKSAEDKKVIAKSNRQRAGHLGIRKQSSRPMPCGKNSLWKKKMNGEVVRR